MTQKNKRIKDIINNTKNVRFLDLDKYLLDCGYERRQSGKGSSHFVYCHPNVNILIVLVSHGKNEILPEYMVKKALNSIKLLENINE